MTIDDGVWKDAGNVIIGDAGSGTLNVVDNGVVTIGGNAVMGCNTGATGNMTIASGGSVTVAGGFHLMGGPAHGTAKVSAGAAISGFALGDIIAMAGVDAVSFNAKNGMLTLSEHGVQVDRLHLTGSFAGNTFAVHQSAAGALISLQHT